MSNKLKLRIDGFIEELSKLSLAKDIDELCRKEVTELKENFQPTTAKRYISEYRKAIKALQGKRRDRAMKLIMMDKETAETIDYSYRQKVSNFRNDPIVIPSEKISEFIEKGKNQLTAKTLSGTMQGLAILTGRRGYELLNCGYFWKYSEMKTAINETAKILPDYLINSAENIEKELKILGLNPDNCLLFSGQAKTNEKSIKTVKQPFVIPVLAAPDDILAAFKWLRSNFSKYADMTMTEINNKTQKTLNDPNTGVKNSKNYGLLLPRQHCQFKALRKVYAAICSKQCTKPIVKNRFYSMVLGHGESSTGTAASYDYFLFDDYDCVEFSE